MANQKIFNNLNLQGLEINNAIVNNYDNLAAITAATVTYALGVDDHGFRAYAKDTKKFYKWTGTALEEVPETTERITIVDNTLLTLADVVDLGVDLRKNTLYKNEAGMIVDVTSEGTATLITDGVESGRIVFKAVAFVPDTEVIFNINKDATIDFQSGKAIAGSIQEVENKFLMATGIAVHYKDGTEHYLDSSSKVRVIDNETFGITLGISAEMVVSLEVNLKDVLPLNTGTLNTFTFNTGTAPTLVDFETAIGFTLVDGFTDGTVVKFNNTGYAIADNAFKGNVDLLNIATAPNVTAGNNCFYGCTSLTSTGNVTTAGNNCFYGCTSLTSTGNVTTAGNYCFQNCASLTSTGLITTAGTSCFAGCTSLTSTGNVTTAGNYCFYDCTSLTNMDFTNCNNFGTTTGNDVVFANITGLTINLTAKAIHQTSNGGSMEGDLAYLFANNTVNATWL